MKTELGVSVAVLAALAAHGKDFDRATLNAMLDKLAASPEPEQVRGAIAMCYSMGSEETEGFDFVCKKCGRRTRYDKNRDYAKGTLAFYRDEAVRLHGKGLDITLDESALCRYCTSLKDLKIPTRGVVVAEPEDAGELGHFGLRVSDEVRILSVDKDYDLFRIVPLKVELWIQEKYLDKSDKVISDDVAIRYVPVEKGDGACTVDKGTQIVRMERRRDDPAGWTRIKLPQDGWMDSYVVNRAVVGKFGYDEGDFASTERIKGLAWTIGGVSTIVNREDPRLLERFMDDEVYFNDGKCKMLGPSVSMKSKLPRLRELLGIPEK